MNVTNTMISRNRWLWWKEFRMVVPLVALLVGVVVLLFLISSIAERSLYGYASGDDLRSFVPLAFPLLFALGSGMVLVGQERETRTIEWMSSLPLAPRQWVNAKILVAGAGLVTMWVLAALFLWTMGGDGGFGSRWRLGGMQGVASAPVGYPLWILFSVYLLFCSFYAAWKLDDQFHAIVLLVALACVPIVLTEVFGWTFGILTNRSSFPGDLQGVTLLITTALTGWMAWCADRTAIQTLRPQSAGEIFQPAADRVSGSASFWSTAPDLGSSWSSLIWQSIRSAPATLAITFGLVLTGLLLPMMFSRATSGTLVEAWLPSLVLVSPLAMTWLGVLVFQNDGSADRLRFLADRGVSPTKVYLARHAVPLAMLAFGVIVYTMLATWRVQSSQSTATQGLLPSPLTIVMLGAVVYSVSQWTSQLFRTLVLSVILSPIVAGLILGWFTWSAVALQTPIWILVGASSVPIIATYFMMPGFMDKRDRPLSFVVATGVLAIIFGSPIVHAIAQIRQIPGIAGETRSDLLDQGRRFRKSVATPFVLTMSHRDDLIFQLRGDESVVSPNHAIQYINDAPKTPEEFFPTLAEIRNRPDVPVTVDKFNVDTLLNQLTLLRMKFESDGDWESFAPWLVATSELSRALRLSVTWRDQDAADVIEIWLADALQSPAVIGHQSDAAYRRTIQILSDRNSRKQSRRKAVLSTWAGQELILSDIAGNNTIDEGLRFQPIALSPWTKKPRAESIVATALEAIDASGNGDWLVQMHDLQVMPTVPFAYGPYAPRFRDRPAIELLRAASGSPAQYWGMQWEDDIEQLKAEANQPNSEIQP